MKQSALIFCVGAATLSTVGAFTPNTQHQNSQTTLQLQSQSQPTDGNGVLSEAVTDRRGMLLSAGLTVAAATVATAMPMPVLAAEVDLQQYEDFTKAPEGWSYRDVNVGNGDSPSTGDRAVYEWSGYTIGYFGRPFEARGGPQGGAFDKSQDYSRHIIGKGDIVKGVDLALSSMKVGGIRQVIVPYGDLGYPSTKDGDASHDLMGPKPSTFSGERALNFVLDNPRVDRTLLFNVKLIRVDKSDGNGGFKRGDKA
jgi:FKBP-type peptidyl-prolyl cis-trans isomerase